MASALPPVNVLESTTGRRTPLTWFHQLRCRIEDVLAFHFERTSGVTRLCAFDGLRGAGALTVFLFHFHAMFVGAYLAPTSMFTRLVWLLGTTSNTGVFVFFALSGYLIYGIALTDWFGYWSFMRRRIQRIYPTFSAVFALYVLLSILNPERSKIPAGSWQATKFLAANFLMWPALWHQPRMITVSWTLSYEFAFYAVIPLLVVVLRMRRWSSGARLLFVGILSIASLASIADAAVVMFGAGMIAWELSGFPWIDRFLTTNGERLAIAAIVCLLVLVAIILRATDFNGGAPVAMGKWLGWCAPLVVLVFLLYAGRFDGAVNRFFSNRYLRWFGTISFSYYLTHGLVLAIMKLLLQSAAISTPLSVAGATLLLGLALLATLTTGAAVFMNVETRFSFFRSVRRPSFEPASATHTVS